MKSLVIIIPIPPGKGYVFSNGKERIIYPKDYFLRLLELTKDTVLEYQNDVEISIVTSNYNGITIESINQITTCELAIAFATARISNTFWQIGLRHGTKKPTIIFQDEKDDSKLGIIGGLMSYSYSIESKKDENKFKERLIDKLNIYELSRPDLMDKNGFENLNLGLTPIYLNLLDLIRVCLKNRSKEKEFVFFGYEKIRTT